MIGGGGRHRARGPAGAEFRRLAIFAVLPVLAFADVVPAPAPWAPSLTPAAAAAEKRRCSLRPRYPDRALQRGIQGYALLRFDIEARGHTSNIRIVKAFPPGFFEREAMQVGRRLCYEPAPSAASPREVVGRDFEVLVVYDLHRNCGGTDELVLAARRHLARSGISVPEDIGTIVVTAGPPADLPRPACEAAPSRGGRR